MKRIYITTLIALLSISAVHAQHKPISLHPKNPHYFLYQDKPTILITSAEHYGAVLNLDFDFAAYLDELHANGLNLTRTFTGVYIEPAGAFNIAANTLAPSSGRYVCPWARSKEPGFAGGGNKFDLSRWDETYFIRLKNFVAAAATKGVIVELALFCPFYEENQWAISPMNAGNNINGTGILPKDDVYTLDKNGSLLAFQEAVVQKIVRELKAYHNVIYEICNEPYFGGVKLEWQHHIASLIQKTEQELGVTHLISQNIANDSAKIVNPHPGVSVFNFHYATPPTAVKQNYQLNKVIGDNETGFKGQADSSYRKEGWEFILAGGGLYNNLDYSFTTSNARGTFVYPAKTPGGGTPALRKQLKHLKTFIERFDFITMTPDRSFITGGLPAGARIHVLSTPGKQYAAYILHGNQVTLLASLPAGNYDVEWLDPVSGNYIKKERLKHGGGKASLASPSFKFDVALRIVATK